MRIRAVLGTNLVGVYLYGSLLSGDFDPDTSDLELLAVTEQTVSTREYKALKTFKTRTSAIVTISPGEPMHVIKAGIDWIINWYEIQEKGAAFVSFATSRVLRS